MPSFKYLGHIIDNCMSDDADISRELKCLFSRANVLIMRFKSCSWTVKIRLFKAFCVYVFYDIGLWSNFKLGTINKLAAAYTRCLKKFFCFYKYSSVTDMLLQLGLPTFNTILHNNRF